MAILNLKRVMAIMLLHHIRALSSEKISFLALKTLDLLVGATRFSLESSTFLHLQTTNNIKELNDIFYIDVL